MKNLWLAGFCCVLGCALAQAVAGETEEDRGRLYVKAADPGGGKLTFTWEQVGGPPAKIADPTACKPVVEEGKTKYVSDTYYLPTEPGKYKFKVTIRAEDGQETKKEFSQEVLRPTPPPVAVAGKDKAVIAGQLVVLNGIDSKAAPGMNITEWEWRVAQAPPKFNLDDKKLKERQFEFKADKPGVYQFELRVSDGKRWSEPSNLMVTVKANLGPPKIEELDENPKTIEIKIPEDVPAQPKQVVKAVAFPGQTLRVGELLVLDGSPSQAEEKLKPAFLWKQLRQGTEPLIKSLAPDKSKPFSKNRVDPLNYPVWTCRPEQPGEYTFVLSLETKAEGQSEAATAESDPAVYKVLPASAPPTAVAVADKTEYEAGDIVKLDGSNSRAGEGGTKITDYIWGPVAGKPHPKNWSGTSGPKVEFRAEEDGQLGVMLVVVNDNKERSQPTEITINVGPANKPPVIELPKSYEGEAGGKVRMEAKVTDPQNDRVEVKWSCIDPPELSIPEKFAKDPVLVFKPSNPGTYVFKIVAKNAKGRSAEAQTMVGVKAPGGQPPTAFIEGPNTVKLGEKVKLSGAKSASFPRGKALTYTWSQVETEGAPKLAAELPGEKEKTWEFTPTEPGRYVVSLVVADGAQKSEAERFEFTVVSPATPPVTPAKPQESKITSPAAAPAETAVLPPVKPPVAKISGPASVKAGEQVVLSAEGSSSPDGKEINGYIWSQPTDGGGPGIGVRGKDLRNRELHFKPEKPGTYVLKLEVVDADGNKSEVATHSVEVKGINRPPLADVEILGAKEPYLAGKELKLSAHKSRDPQGAPLTFKWKQNLGAKVEIPDASLDTINITPLEPGEYEFVVVANNGENDSQPAKTVFTVRAPNRPPIAVIALLTPCEPGEKITLDGTGSHDPDNDKIEYQWRQVSGPDATFPSRWSTKPKVEVILPKEGEYVFELKVFDGKEWGEPVNAAVKTLPPSLPPIAEVASRVIRTEENMEVVLDASPSHTQDNAPQPLKYSWKALDKVTLISDGPDKPTARFKPTKSGAYRFEVRVTAGKRESPQVEVKVEVAKAGTLPRAVALVAPNPLKAAQRNNPNDPNILVLDGAKSTSGEAAKAAAAKEGKAPPSITYTWRQVSGDDLNLNPLELAKARVGLRIFTPGNYGFSLTVSDGQNTSPPAVVEVKVIEDAAAK